MLQLHRTVTNALKDISEISLTFLNRPYGLIHELIGLVQYWYEISARLNQRNFEIPPSFCRPINGFHIAKMHLHFPWIRSFREKMRWSRSKSERSCAYYPHRICKHLPNWRKTVHTHSGFRRTTHSQRFRCVHRFIVIESIAIVDLKQDPISSSHPN